MVGGVAVAQSGAGYAVASTPRPARCFSHASGEGGRHTEGGRGSPRRHATGGAPPPDPTAPMPDPPPAAALLPDLASGRAHVEEKGMEEGCRAR